ncbi:MAG: hypothetical protein ACI31S_06360 [Bacilli bacterium]
MEEKNKLIISYIDSKVKEVEEMSMFVPKENVEKLYTIFTNREEDINIIKTKIDSIFTNSINAYRQNLEKTGSSYDEVIAVYQKVEKMNKTKAKLYLAGAIVPYILLGEDSKRRHSNLDLLCSKEDIRMVREIFRTKDLYDPKKDSLTYTVNNIDYGFVVTVDKVKVNIAVFEEADNGIIEYNFDDKRRVGRIKNIAVKLNDYIVPYVSSDNKKYMTLSLELLIANKLLTNREKDKKDIEKIKECNGISDDKIKKIPLPLIKEEKLVGDNLEFTSTMPRIKLEIPKKKNEKGFINFATILLLIGIVVCIILGS